MESLLLLLLLPLIGSAVSISIWKQQLPLKPFLICAGLIVAIITAGWFVGRASQSWDVEIWNGQVESKQSRQGSCEHSYVCNCRQSCTSSTNGGSSCTTTCDTCYEHAFDITWELNSNVGNIRINREDRQGLIEPSRWRAAQIGDPVAVTNSYTNYVKGAPNSLFNALAEKNALVKYQAIIPPYPSDIIDYHYVNRVLPVGVSMPDIATWNQELALRLRKLGAEKQVNWVFVITSQANPDFADALRVAWLGGKKNDVIVILGTPSYPKIDWVRVLSWSDKELFKVQLRDDLLALGTVQQSPVFDIVEKHVRSTYSRKRMREFAYLQAEIRPPFWLLVVLGIFSVLASLGNTWFWMSRSKQNTFLRPNMGFSSNRSKKFFNR